MRTLYMRNLVKDLWQHKIAALLIFLICVALAGAWGLKSVKEISDEEYQSVIKAYDESVVAAEKDVEISREQVAELQKYVDNSIYMKLDGQAYQEATVQYVVANTGNSWNIQYSLLYFVNDGELKNQINEIYPQLEPSYWREIMNCEIGGNSINITLIHYDAEMIKQILSIIEERIEAYAPELIPVHGDFTLEKIGESFYEKADNGITTNQVNINNNLKAYQNSFIDYENRYISLVTGKDDFINQNAPVGTGGGTDTLKTLFKFLAFGVIAGVVIPFAYFALAYVLDNRIRDEKDLEALSLQYLGTTASADALQAVAILAKKWNAEKLCIDFLVAPNKSDAIKTTMESSLVETNYSFVNSAEQTETPLQLLDSSHAVLVIEPGYTKYASVQKEVALCKQYRVELLGALIIK